jgi:hypothetical protein
VASERNPQTWPNPALTWVNVPAGTVSWPKAFRPQQSTVPSERMAQTSKFPVLMDVYVRPPDSTGTFSWPYKLLPQQVMAPALSAQP